MTVLPGFAALVCGLTQSRKTKRTFDLLKYKLNQHQQTQESNNLVIYITQANCTVSASQVICRARDDDFLATLFNKKNIIRSFNIEQSNTSYNFFIADYWNIRNLNKILEFISTPPVKRFTKAVIVIDEADTGAQTGLSTRLSFIRDVEKALSTTTSVCELGIILVTATVANLCKSAGALISASQHTSLYRDSPILNKLLYENSVEYHFVQPSPNYVGPSWFVANADKARLKVLKFEKRKKDQDRDEYLEARTATIEKSIANMSSEDKQLSLIVISTKKEDHGGISMRLLENCGYNVAVELNSECVRDYTIYYKSTTNQSNNTITQTPHIKEWRIPVARIERMASRGELSTWQDPTTLQFIETGIEGPEDISLSHLLAAATLMNTVDYREQISSSSNSLPLHPVELARLSTLAAAMKRPRDYPQTNLRIGIVAGHIASRGNTIQNASINFVCTSHCFTDSIDNAQRGAINAQRFGRVCGILMDAYRSRNREPMIIATEPILRDALSNEAALLEASMSSNNSNPTSTLICLADFITSGEWSRTLRKSKKRVVEATHAAQTAQQAQQQFKPKVGLKVTLKNPQPTIHAQSHSSVPLITRMEERLLNLMKTAPDGKMELTNAALGSIDPELNTFVRSQNRYLFTYMASKGLIKNIEPKKSIWQLIEHN